MSNNMPYKVSANAVIHVIYGSLHAGNNRNKIMTIYDFVVFIHSSIFLMLEIQRTKQERYKNYSYISREF